jgi:hypothetical protein
MGLWVDIKVAEGRFSECYFSSLKRETITSSETQQEAQYNKFTVLKPCM